MFLLAKAVIYRTIFYQLLRTVHESKITYCSFQ